MSSVLMNNGRVAVSCLKAGSLFEGEEHFGLTHGRVFLFPRKRVFVVSVRPARGRLGFVCGRGWVWGHLCHQPVLRLGPTLMAICIRVSSVLSACLYWIECLWGQQELLNILEPELGTACAERILLSCSWGPASMTHNATWGEEASGRWFNLAWCMSI